MLKVIKRVLRLSGDLSKRIYASFVFSFIDSIVAMFPVGAVFYTLTKIQNNKAFAGNDWLVLFGMLSISLGSDAVQVHFLFCSRKQNHRFLPL